MYDNIKSLRLVKEGSQTIVTGMISSEGEVMEFRHSGRYCSIPFGKRIRGNPASTH